MTPPTLDDRSREEIFEELTELTDQYVDDWEPESADMATVLLRIASEFEMETVQRLNRLPRKHRAAFLDSLDFQRQPSQAARLPLSVGVSDDLDRNVTVPGGTQALATTTDDETELFEIPQGEGFEATPASLTASYAVDPDADRLVSHEAMTEGRSQMLFAGPNAQQHALYLGDEELLTLESSSVIDVELTGSVDSQAIETSGRWEYYGLDGEETEGWHRLPTAEAATDDQDSLLGRQLDRSPPDRSPDEGYSVSLRLPGELVPTAIDGTESRWIRYRIQDRTSACFATKIESAQLRVGQSTETGQTTPDAGFASDVPLTLDDDSPVHPFGQIPQPSSTVYLAAAEALSKSGATVTLRFHPPNDDVADLGSAADASSGPGSTDTAAESGRLAEADFGALGGPPELSWEYWNGTGWAGLSVQSDSTDDLQTAGEIQFEVPDDIAETAVSGQEARWIRGRLVSGSYGRPSVAATGADNAGGSATADHPKYDRISVSYEHTDTAVSQLATENNGTVGVQDTTPFEPFRRLAEENQTIYFGFDDVLRSGPIPIFIPLAEASYPPGFDPGVEWEYCANPETDTWAQLGVDDGTGGLTQRGIVSLRFPEPTTAYERFGRECHWIRATVTEDSFATHRQSEPTAPPTAGDSPVAEPPVISGLYPNTQWADNARTVEDEILGASDGSGQQRFECAHGPLIDCEVWVDESGSLSATERADLRDADPDRIEVVTNQQGDCTAFWVRWESVEEFIGVDSDRRVYRCDRSSGTITFGDGEAGKIPPRGQDSIRATYTTGGGAGGNVEAGAVTDLKTPISLVESVDNPLPADGGADAEPTDAVATRAASEIRTRGRAVTAEDFEQIAATAIRKLGTVECKPHLGPDGGREPGSITLLVVPDTHRERPRPSMALEQQVQEAVSEAAPATLTRGESSGIVVRGPSYAPVSVDVTVQATGVTSISVLKTDIESRLASYLHPLTGGPEGEGWTFGEPPTAEALVSLLREIDRVDRVIELSATIECGDDYQQLTQGPSQPTLPADGLVCTGTHDITVQVGESR